MFDHLSNKLSDVFDKLRGRGALSEQDVTEAMREIRLALLEADVALPVVKEFIENVKESIVGEEITKSIQPGQMVVKLVHDHLCKTLGEDAPGLFFEAKPPIVMMMVGLQGAGKTTSVGKLAKFMLEKHGKRVLVASLDVARPAAQEQLVTLAETVGAAHMPVNISESPLALAKQAYRRADLEGFDVLVLDTAGRLHTDESLMGELKTIKKETAPHEILLVADSLTGQDAVRVASEFHDALSLTGIILTRADADARGGAALSMRQTTGCPIKFLGCGEKPSDLEPFHAERVASRILGMGDVVSLVEKAAEVVDQKEAERASRRLAKGLFDLDDLAKQLSYVGKMGGLSSMMGMLPGLGGLKNKIKSANLDEKLVSRQIAIIQSMTKKEKKNVKLLNASRKKRIASGAGVHVSDINTLVKQFLQMQKMMKRMKNLPKGGLGGLDMKGLMGNGGNGFPGM